MPADRKSRIHAVARVSSGNFLEMYDFMVFGYYAAAIGRAFFPSGNAYTSLMLSLMTFGAGFLMRPLGALVLGAYTDKHGRRAGLMLTLMLMSVGIVTIAFTAGVRDHRPGCTPPRSGWPPPAGILGRHGARRCLRVPVGDRHAGTQGLLRQLAVGEPAGGCDVRGPHGRDADLHADPGRDGRAGDGACRCSSAARSFRFCSACADRSRRPASSSLAPDVRPHPKSCDRSSRTGR